jgi:cbb3-type cytochrome oxidase maturation protein
MNAILWLLPIALTLGLCGLLAFFWSMKSGQFEDLKGDASRIFEEDDKPL